MRFVHATFLVLATALILLAGAHAVPAQRGDQKIRDSIIAANREFIASFARGDGAGVAALYTADGQLLQPNGAILSGRQAIRGYWQGAIDSGLKQIRLETAEVEGMGRTAAEVGRYAVLGGDGRVLDAGKYVVLWRLERGKWRLHRDIWNSDMPAPAPQN